METGNNVNESAGIVGLDQASEDELKRLQSEGIQTDSDANQEGQMVLAPIDFFYQEVKQPDGTSEKKLLCFSPATGRFYTLVHDLQPMEHSEEDSKSLITVIRDAYMAQQRRAMIQSGGEVPPDVASILMQR